MKIAIVSDPLTEYGGEQRVLEVLHEMFPKAPVYTGLLNLPNLPKRFKDWPLKTPCHPVTTLIKLVPLRSLRLLLIPLYVRFNLSEYDLIISSGTLFAKGGGSRRNKGDKGDKGNKGPKHIAYIHTPPRFLYGYETSSGMRSKNCSGCYYLH